MEGDVGAIMDGVQQRGSGDPVGDPFDQHDRAGSSPTYARQGIGEGARVLQQPGCPAGGVLGSPRVEVLSGGDVTGVHKVYVCG